MQERGRWLHLLSSAEVLGELVFSPFHYGGTLRNGRYFYRMQIPKLAKKLAYHPAASPAEAQAPQSPLIVMVFGFTR